jgi:hypothetical protein
MRSLILNSALAIGFFASLGANYFLFTTRYQATFMRDIEAKRSQLNEDMTNEILMSRINTVDTNQIEIAKMQGYNEGVLACAFKLDPKESQISNIWHSGYARGLEQTAFVEELSYEKGYSAGITAGQKDNMKAIQTILKSGDNIQKAIEKFANELQKEEPKEKDEKQPAQQIKK